MKCFACRQRSFSIKESTLLAQQSIWKSVAAGVAVTTLLMILVATVMGGQGNAGAGGYASNEPPPGKLKPGNMLGWSHKAIGERALQDIRGAGMVLSGTPEVLHVRNLRRVDFPDAGLGCMVDVGTIEEPPYVLVIVKGHIMARFGQSPYPEGNYIAYVYDVWAGVPANFLFSGDGALFKKVLNNLSLPDPRRPLATNCPPYEGPRTRHYGDPFPTGLPGETPTALPTYPPEPTAPSGVATFQVPIATPSK